jgi:flagellar biosynthesis/type III secretory pathway protein FliH
VLRHYALTLILIAACLLLSSCYDETDLTIRYEEGYYEGYEAGYNEGFEWGYESGYYDHGFPDGYDFGYEEASSQFENDFEDLWEDWLYQSYGITEDELCKMLGFY